MYNCTYRLHIGTEGKYWLKMDNEVTKMCKIVTVLSIIGQVQVSGHQKLFACVDGVFTYVPAKFYVSRPYDLLTTRGFWITGNNRKRGQVQKDPGSDSV